MKKTENNYAFSDSQNVNLAIEAQGWRLDFARFRVYLRDKYQVGKAFLFIGYILRNKFFYNKLRGFGYEIVFKPVLNNVKVKGNCDGELILHAMIEYNNYDKAVIATGDGDFYCLVDYLNKKDKLLKILVPNSGAYSRLLRPFAPNKLDFMNNLRSKLERRKRPV